MKRESITILDNEKYLRQISKEVLFDDSNLIDEIADIEQFCLERECFALAAVQIGIPKRIIYLKKTVLDEEILEDKEYNERQIIINPVITKREGLTKYWEACVSCLNKTGLVKRPYHIYVTYYDVNGTEYNRIFTGFEATVFSHEYDHLDGILHIDISEDIKEMDKEERKELRKHEPYVVLYEDGNFDDLMLEE